PIDRRQRTGRLLGCEDDEFLVIFLVFVAFVIEIEFVLFLVVLIIGRRRRGRLAGMRTTSGMRTRGKLLVGFGRRGGIRRSRDRIIGRWGLGRHETNRTCTA